jgi:hypothetical protein
VSGAGAIILRAGLRFNDKVHRRHLAPHPSHLPTIPRAGRSRDMGRRIAVGAAQKNPGDTIPGVFVREMRYVSLEIDLQFVHKEPAVVDLVRCIVAFVGIARGEVAEAHQVFQVIQNLVGGLDIELVADLVVH